MLRKLKERFKKLKTWQKALVIVGAVVVGVPLLGMLYLRFAFPDAREADPGLDVDRTPPAISRGEYLFHVVADCSGCHTRRDFRKFGGPMVAQLGAGSGDHTAPAKAFPFADLPGEIYGANITMDRETGIGTWSDDEIIRAIREGVRKDESPLFPMMPYSDYRFMSDTDVQAIVAYIRHMPSVARAVPRSNVDFPLSLIMRTIPEPLTEPVPDINRQDRIKYGEYLARMAGCIECHTQRIEGERQESMLLAGGQAFALEGQTWEVLAANLTPHPQTGMRMTEQQFVDRFFSYAEMAKGEAEIPNMNPQNGTAMPWLAFSALNDSDLRTIYAYLRSVPAIANQVTPRRPRAD